MIYLLLTIILTTAIYIVFKLLDRFNVDILHALVFNYLIASVSCGLFAYQTIETNTFQFPQGMGMVAGMGILFISTFFIYAYSTKIAGIAATSVVSRMSVIIPVLFGFFAFKESMNILKIGGIILALFAFYLSTKKEEDHIRKFFPFLILLLVFIGVGVVDTMQSAYRKFYIRHDHELFHFLFYVYSFSLMIGISVLVLRSIIQKRKINQWGKHMIAGIIIGVFNVGATFSFIKGVGYFQISTFIPILNVSLVLINTLIGFSIFKEKFRFTNVIGVIIAIVAIIIISKS